MYTEAVQALGDQAVAKLAGQRRSLTSHLVRSMLAGMYVGAAIVLIFTIGGTLSATSPGAVRLLMGVCFGGALTIVIFAGSELFTGSNLVLTLAVFTKRASLSDLMSNWLWTWIGNLAGSMLIAWMVIQSGLFNADPIKAFVLKLVDLKMNLPPDQLILRAILANWMVCLGVWMAVRIKSETARVLMIWSRNAPVSLVNGWIICGSSSKVMTNASSLLRRNTLKRKFTEASCSNLMRSRMLLEVSSNMPMRKGKSVCLLK